MIQSGGTLELQEDITSGQVVVATADTSATLLDGVTLESGASISPIGSILSGGTLSVAADAPIVTAVVSSGGLLLGPGSIGFFEDFVVVTGITEVTGGYNFGGGFYVESGGFASGNVIDTVEYVLSGGVASDLIASSATLVYGAALTSGQFVTIAGSSITSTTTVGGDTLLSGATLLLLDPTILDGATLLLGGGTTSKVSISGGVVIVGSGALAVNTKVAGGGLPTSSTALGAD